jgi:hypothetical protein
MEMRRRKMMRSMKCTIAALPVALPVLLAAHLGAMAQTSPDPVGALNDQKTQLTLQFSSAPSAKVTLNAREVDGMITMLAQMRAAMNPPRPMVDPAPGTKINVATAGRWHLEPDGAGVDLDILHPGYGWVGIEMNRASAEELSRALSRSPHPVATRARRLPRRE